MGDFFSGHFNKRLHIKKLIKYRDQHVNSSFKFPNLLSMVDGLIYNLTIVMLLCLLKFMTS